MIKFFRKIRQNLLSEGKNGNYLKYAIGEIVLVVIGILIALQINNWNQGRVNKKNENEYLTEIIKEIEANISLTNYYINDRLPVKIEGLTNAKNYCENKEQVQDTLAFLKKISMGGLMSTGISFLSTRTYDELLSTGNFQLITNDSLKMAVKNYYWKLKSDIENINSKTSNYADFVNKLRPFNPSNPNFISKYDQKEMMVAFNSTEFRRLVDLEFSFAYDIQIKANNLNEFGQKLIEDIKDK
jgi:hypothetical protein